VLAKEMDKRLCPWNRCVEPALDGAVTAACACLARDAQHRDAPGHREERQDNATELADGRRGQNWVQAL